VPSLHEVIILGAGPAGMAAGLFCARLGHDVLLIERGQIGGHLINKESIEEYPGFPEGINGAELGMKMFEQATKAGMKSSFGEATALNIGPDECSVTAFDEVHRAKAGILCTGLSPIRLSVAEEEKFSGRGISYCATCDGSLYRGHRVAVIGGGDLAVEDALYLSNLAQSIILIYQGERVRAARPALEQLSSKKNIIHIPGSAVESILGSENVTGLRVKNVPTGEFSEVPVEGVFVGLGMTPNTQFLEGSLPLTETRHIITDDSFRAQYDHLFAAGDVRSGSLPYVAAAVGEGAKAALMVERYLNGQ
jgi:thioredoxin reductase (NADPH)